ncbi:hypothetical protein GCM10010168_69780 [Actinoplanes ianthinogenes]|uniref:PPE family protein n=1 Tax=Actinoplanes ianthinogenes TaxID=122358 RepID=A0ABM7M0R5_9ACTN|nr:hypothetical protein [Actinoplanes ianthinogenes]BCJ45177.1 hypothetical protein Aiant_58340 [Actinoplanes ianthinogenes]GGR41086.1 hypothetical protein GCM10010168_69780 [Actinoplanes ianthinogenes]
MGVEYWGASADPNYGYSPYSGQLHYGSHAASDAPFTQKAGEGNNTTIEEIHRKIHNMHPERIAVLADQWQNAWTLMSEVRSYLLAESEALEKESWKSPKAREAFLKMGPGQSLAYLDVWMDAAQVNVTQLRHVVLITKAAQNSIDDLVDQYKKDLGAAADVTGMDQLGHWLTHWNTTWTDAEKNEARDDINDVKKDYQERAQRIAYYYGNEIYGYIGKLSNGMGPPVRPMDAVLNTPGKPPTPALPNLPGGGGGAPPPPAFANTPPLPGQGNAPTLPPGANDQVKLPDAPGDQPGGNQQPGQQPGVLPVLPPLPGQSTVPPPNAVPPPTGLPGLLPGQLPPALPGNGVLKPPAFGPGLTQNAPGPLSPGLKPGTSAPTSPPNPGQLGRNSFGRGPAQPPGTGQPPGRTLRRPGSTNPSQPGRPGDRRRGEDRSRQTGTPYEGEESFSRPPGGMPPVLKNPAGDRDRRRPGSTEELRPTTPASGDAFRPDGTAPPVLNRPTGPATPPSPARRRETTQRDRQPTAWADYFGSEQARVEAGSGMLEAPSVPPTGAGVSRLEEIPRGLRSRAATQAAGQHPQGTVSPELSKRRTTAEPTPAGPQDDEAPGIVTDERAFEVQTPGGGVVTSKRDEPVYEPEIRRALGGGQ